MRLFGSDDSGEPGEIMSEDKPTQAGKEKAAAKGGPSGRPPSQSSSSARAGPSSNPLRAKALIFPSSNVSSKPWWCVLCAAAEDDKDTRVFRTRDAGEAHATTCIAGICPPARGFQPPHWQSIKPLVFPEIQWGRATCPTCCRTAEDRAPREVHTRESFIAAQLDTVSFTARALLPLIARDLWYTGEAAPEGTRERQRQVALELLANWNGEMNEHLPEPLIYAAWLRQLQHKLIVDVLYGLVQS